MKRILLLLSIIFSSPAQAATTWSILFDQSKIEFLANQDGTEISGFFKKFSGEIFFDKADLKNSKVAIDIDLTSLSSSFGSAVTELPKQNWFYTAKFPRAKFTSEKFTKISENKFRSAGFLEMKGVKIPLTFDFFFEEYSTKKAKASGSFFLSRSQFGIGSKDEKAADGVKDTVTVKFSIRAVK